MRFPAVTLGAACGWRHPINCKSTTTCLPRPPSCPAEPIGPAAPQGFAIRITAAAVVIVDLDRAEGAATGWRLHGPRDVDDPARVSVRFLIQTKQMPKFEQLPV